MPQKQREDFDPSEPMKKKDEEKKDGIDYTKFEEVDEEALEHEEEEGE